MVLENVVDSTQDSVVRGVIQIDFRAALYLLVQEKVDDMAVVDTPY